MKPKTLVLAGIVVCTILLTSPALASAGYSKIYGNANEDDVLDMRDVTYIKLVIFGKKPATTFADANNDGKISMLDIGQTKLIILGKEKQLTLVDQADRTVTIYWPVERVVTIGEPVVREVVILGAADKVVGIDSGSAGAGKKLFCLQAHPELMDLPTVGAYNEPNMEAILELKADVAFVRFFNPGVADSIQEKTGIPAVCLQRVEPSDFKKTYESLRLAGRILGKEDRAEWLISYVEDKLDPIRKITNKIPEEEKPKVYALVACGIRHTMVYAPVEWAGGNTVAKEYLLSRGLTSAQINPEQVIVWNPDVIFAGASVAKLLEVHPGLEVTKAVKEGKVYQIFGPYHAWDLIQVVAETYYIAKILHPDKFQDLDVEKEANKMFKEVYGADDLYNKVQEARGVELYRWE